MRHDDRRMMAVTTLYLLVIMRFCFVFILFYMCKLSIQYIPKKAGFSFDGVTEEMKNVKTCLKYFFTTIKKLYQLCMKWRFYSSMTKEMNQHQTNKNGT